MGTEEAGGWYAGKAFETRVFCTGLFGKGIFLLIIGRLSKCCQEWKLFKRLVPNPPSPTLP